MAEADEPGRTAPEVAKAYPTQAVQLIRTATQSHLVLSQMADQKASILLGATFVVFTIVVGQARSGSVPVPLLILACFAFLSAVCAVMVVTPQVRVPPAVKGESNMLFFGVFTQFSEAEFSDYVVEQIATDEGMFRTMLRDVYQNGQVLRRKKYRWLGYAYRVFLAGLTLTLVDYLLEMFEVV